MKKQKTVKNLVTMVQSKPKAKTFRIDYPVSNDLLLEMVTKVFRDFMNDTLDLYYHDENLSVLEEIVEEHNPKEEKKESLLDNLFWWQILNSSGQNKKRSCIEDYIGENFHRFRTKPFMTSWLRACDQAEPKFYFIGETFNERIFFAIDILTHKPHLVFIFDRNSIPPKHGELVMGTLLPLGGNVFFPIVDFYHFDYESREAMASCFHYHYSRYKKEYSKDETFLHVLSVMLQIERMIFLENQEKQNEALKL
ncbi:hypothetical protein [Neobacillus sp. LXY-4]|uniref:hypothetical protein n=1 Tax=Neobacillus sp. LXY-4 TaxID=3379826 RepID=UPI003EE122AA